MRPRIKKAAGWRGVGYLASGWDVEVRSVPNMTAYAACKQELVATWQVVAELFGQHCAVRCYTAMNDRP